MARVMVVDDEQLNVKLLRAILEPQGHEIIAASSGEEALERARECDPDIVLLDLLMPGMDGIETLRHLKKMAKPHFLPVVLVTALDDSASRHRGLQAGADDFVTKPVDATVVRLRVANLVSQRADRHALSERNDQLAQLQRYKEELAALLVHDLKNPASVILTNLDYARRNLPYGPEGDVHEALSDARECCLRMLRLFANLLDIERAEDDRLRPMLAPTDVAEVLDPLVRVRVLAARSRSISIDSDIRPGLALIDADLVARMVENLLDNALHHTPRKGRIVIKGCMAEGRLFLCIGNTGAPVPPEARERLFQKYGRVRGDADRRLGAGFGLYFCRLVATSHGGDIAVKETAELPTVFAVSLPADAGTAS